MSRRVVPAAALAGLALAGVPMPAALSAAGLALALLGLPMLGWTRALDRTRPATEGVALALALAPGMVALALLPLLPVGPAALARLAWVVPVAIASVGALAAWVGARKAPAPAAGDARAGWIAAGVVALAFALVPALAPREDGWFHAAVALQVLERGGAGLEDPAYAGLPLLYFWAYQAWAALWLAVDGRLAPWTPLIAFNAAAAASLVVALRALARRLGAGAGGQHATVLMAFAGYAPFAWILLVGRAFTGEVRGFAEVSRLAGQGVDPVLNYLVAGKLPASMAFAGDKFLVLTAFSMGLALFGWTLVLVLDLLERPTAGRAALLAAVLAAAAALHTVVAFAAGVSLAAIAAQRLAGARGGRRPPPWRALALVALATLAAVVVTAPYVLAVAAPRRHPPGVGFGEASWLGWAVWGALFVFPGLAWLAVSSRRSTAARDLLAAAGALSALGLFLALPDGNQSKFLNLLFVLLAPPAALGLLALADRAGAGGRRWLAGALVAALLPNLLLLAWGYAHERGRFDEPSHRPASATLEAWRWLRASTAPVTLVADREGGSDMQVFAARSALWGGGHLERDWGSPIAAMKARRLAARELGAGGPLSAGTAALLRELGRPVVVVDRHPAGPAASSFGRAAGADTSGYRRLRTVPQMTLYEYHPAP